MTVLVADEDGNWPRAHGSKDDPGLGGTEMSEGQSWQIVKGLGNGQGVQETNIRGVW